METQELLDTIRELEAMRPIVVTSPDMVEITEDALSAAGLGIVKVQGSPFVPDGTAFVLKHPQRFIFDLRLEG